VNEPKALDRAADFRGLRYASVSAPLELHFPAATTRRDVAHGLAQVPTGYHVLLATATITADAPQDWTRDVAFLQASAADARAIVVFFTLTEEVQRA
jgi:hypothetical protein